MHEKRTPTTVLRLFLAVFVAAIAPAFGGSSNPNADARRLTPAQGHGAASYDNPVLPGDYPDPSVIRVGNDYWATATTSQWAPIFPLLHSTDLVTWRLTGSVFQRPPAWSAGSYWAPEIAQDGGRFFVYYTARRKNGPLCVAVADAPRPQGPYIDRGPLVCQEVGSIDAVPIRDEHGRRYLVWKEDGNSRKLPTPLWAQPLSNDGRSLVGEKQEILRNEAPWEAHLIEGAFILRRGGWFYLFYSADACCGAKCNYKLGVARARRLLGPWERHTRNPILAANEHWKCPGHGSVVTDPEGRTFLLYHAYHPSGFQYVGRQGLLDELAWEADGWPVINGGRGPSREASAPAAGSGAKAGMVRDITDEFERSLDPGWQWPWDQPVQPAVERARGGWLRLRTGSNAKGPTISVAARPTLTGSYTATTIVAADSISPGARAGLAAFGNRENLLAVSVERAASAAAAGHMAVTVWQMQNGESRPLATDTIDAPDVVHLQLRAADRTRFDFAVSADGQRWKTVAADAEGGYLPPWDLSVRVAVMVSGAPGASARFGAFTLKRGG